MRTIFLAVLVTAVSLPAIAQTSVGGYMRSDGVYVAPHVRSSPNSVQYDNYGARGNTNPFTGKQGTAPSELYPSPSPRGFDSTYPSMPKYDSNGYLRSR